MKTDYHKVEVILPLRESGWVGRTAEQRSLEEEHRKCFINELDSFIQLFLSERPSVEEFKLEEIENIGAIKPCDLEKIKAAQLIEELQLAPHCEILKIDVFVRVNRTVLFENNSHHSPVDLEEHVPFSALITVKNAIEAALTMSELCFPGSISSLVTYFYCNNTMDKLSRKTALYSLGMPGHEKLEWPELHTLDLKKSLKWALKIGYKDEYFAKSRVGRTLAAYSHLLTLTENRSGEQLFRAMQGLEAFYCDGNGDLRKQLQDKTTLWFGDWKSIYSCGKLYEIRSKFVHGSSLINYFGVDVVDAEEDKSYEESINATKLATRLLVATLQRCIDEDVVDIVWKAGFETTS